MWYNFRNIVYIFNDKKSYEKYKNEYVDTNIKNYKGIEQKDIFDDQNYAYENKTTYTYSKLKKNKNVSFMLSVANIPFLLFSFKSVTQRILIPLF